MATYDVYARRETAVPSQPVRHRSSLRMMISTITVVGLLTVPLMLYVAAHANLTRWEYEVTRLSRVENQEQERAGRLRVELAEATAANRIRAEAERMGLVQYDATQIVVVSAHVKPPVTAMEPEPEAGWFEWLRRAWSDIKAWAGFEEVPPNGRR